MVLNVYVLKVILFVIVFGIFVLRVFGNLSDISFVIIDVVLIMIKGIVLLNCLLISMFCK